MEHKTFGPDLFALPLIARGIASDAGTKELDLIYNPARHWVLTPDEKSKDLVKNPLCLGMPKQERGT